MSGECEKCSEHCLECSCRNAKLIPLGDGDNPPAEIPETKWINVNGREEHEAVLKDSEKCKELGLDQMYEIMVYLNRWGSWLDSPTN